MTALAKWEIAEAARHEFGHALVSILLGIGVFHRVVILREPDQLGRFGYIEHTPGQAERRLREPEPEAAPPSSEVVSYAADPKYRPAIENMLRRFALFCYAGIAAQDCRSGGDWWSSRLLETSTQDRRTLSREFKHWGREIHERDMHAGYLRGARRLVDSRWGALEAGSDALLARLGASNAEGSLSYAEAEAIVAATPRARNPWREPEKWLREASRQVAEQFRAEEAARERNVERVDGLAACSTGRALRPAPLAPLSADARERNVPHRTDTGRAPWPSSPRPALAGLPLVAEG